MNNHEVVFIKSGFQNYKLMKSQIINYKLSYFDLCYMHYCLSYFRTNKRKQNILHKHSQNIFLFTHFYFFSLISTHFADFAFLKMQMQITFPKLFKVLNNAMWSML